MDIKLAALYSSTGTMVPLKAARWDGRLFIECRDVTPFLRHLTNDSAFPFHDLPPGAWIRGVVIPGEGAFFQLFDSFGSAVYEIEKLTEEEAQTKILDQMIWQVDTV